MAAPNNGGGYDVPGQGTSRPGSRHHIKRSITELASPGKLHRRQNRRQESQQDERALGLSASVSARLRRSLDLPRSEAATPIMSPDQSRRGSILVPGDGENVSGGDEGKDRPYVRPLHDQQMASIRTDGLKQSLANLNDFSTTMTRRLDETYYSVLERMSTLQNTVVALRELAMSSHSICETFDKDARDLENDIIRQLSAAGHFEEQQRRITTLQCRIRDGREKVQALSSRVDVVQQRVERWERADKAWQEKTRKRLKIIWSVSTVAVLVIIAVVMGLDYAGVQPDPEGRWATSWSSTMSPNIPAWLNRSSGPDEESGRRMLWKAPQGDGEQLRAFDDL